jgi:hypothetical protein
LHCAARKSYRKIEEFKKGKKGRKKGPEVLNFQERRAKTAQVLGNLNENFFDFFDFAVTEFCGSSLNYSAGAALARGLRAAKTNPRSFPLSPSTEGRPAANRFLTTVISSPLYTGNIR